MGDVVVNEVVGFRPEILPAIDVFFFSGHDFSGLNPIGQVWLGKSKEKHIF